MPAHVEQVADQRVQPVGAFFDGGEQFALVLRPTSVTSVCRNVLTLAFTDASGVRRSCPTAASNAVRIRLPSAKPCGAGGFCGQPGSQDCAAGGQVHDAADA